MKWYHGTTELSWINIQSEGVLWGQRNRPSRCTYLADSVDVALKYGTVVLEVDWDPYDGTNNYVKGCWQMREYKPIPISKVVRVV